MGELSGNSAQIGLNLNAITSQVKPGQLTYSLNAQVSGFEGNAVIYQNEQANEFCFTVPEGFKVIGTHQIIEIETVIYWLINPSTGASEIGKVVNNSCIYQTIINATCLNFNIRFPILKAVHKTTNCSVEVYWTDGLNPRRFIDLGNLPFKQVVQGTNEDSCNVVTTTEVDCNKMNVQPNFALPLITYVQVASEGSLPAGDYQFAFQYTNSLGDPYTSFYSITNPIPINDYFKVTPNFDYLTGKSIQIQLTDIDITGLFQYFNIAVIKTINDITSVDLVGTFQIEGSSQKILYTGQSKANVTLSINDIFEKFPVFDVAGDLTTVQDILVWDDLTTTERITYQSIANKIHLQWVSWKIPPQRNGFKDELNAANHRGYMRDEVYPYDMVIILKNGYQSDRFPIPGRLANSLDLSLVSNEDAQSDNDICEQVPQTKPRWEVYNTGTVIDYDPLFKANGSDPCYEGPYQFGEFSYWESTETYPCNEAVWGDLAGKPIRHHKFPDGSVTYHHDSAGNIYPLGVRVDMQAIYTLFKNSLDLTQEQKDKIAAIKIVRGNRANSKSVIAKGLLYNVGVYERDNSTYFYPNYPFNDLRPDPFILNQSNNSIGTTILSQFNDVPTVANTETLLYDNQLPSNTFTNIGDVVTIQYTGRFGSPTFDPKKLIKVSIGGINMFNIAGINANSQDSWVLILTLTKTGTDTLSSTGKLTIQGPTITTLNDNRGSTASFPFATMLDIRLTGATFSTVPPNFHASQDGDIVASSIAINYKAASASASPFLDGFSSPSSRNRFTFHSPDTSFYQPFLGTTLKLESVEFGVTKSHFVQVKNHARYRFPSLNSYLTSLGVGVAIGFLSGTYGLSTQVFDGSAAFTAFTIFNDIIFKLLPKKNFAYSFNSLGNYTTPVILPNDTGNKIRRLDIASYLIPGVQGVGDTNTVNNFQREGSVYLRTIDTLPFPSSVQGVPVDNSRFVLSEVNCNLDFQQRNISSYYGAIKTNYPDQYGQIYSYEAIDTGFQFLLDLTVDFDLTQKFQDVFGGDTFINKFAFKRKLPFFIDNRVNFPDEADIFYDELGNIGFPRFWFSTDVTQGDGGFFNIGSLFGVKVNNFDCKENKFFYNSGKMYLFAYGIVNFFVESAVNVDYRQAFNNREGDYWPHVSGDVPDEWLQENFVTINFDNTYTYNKTYSKQNIENVFTTLPVDFIPGQLCQERFPNKAIYSDRQEDVVFYKKNNWLIYRPVAFYDFPLTYGKLISLEGIENRAVLARFENKSMIYNALLTINTSNPQAAYLGNDTLFKSSPPIDFAETDLGYAGSQNKFFLKTEFGNISTDAKRGNVFLISGNKAQNIAEFGLSQFFMNNLNFQLKTAFPDYNTDNHFKGVGMTGVFDSKYNRFILTKLDYKPKVSGITYNSVTDTFSLNGETIELTDTNFFCNTSFTLSYSFENRSWISFHSYLPNFYVAAIDKFYTGRNDIGSVWRHNTSVNSYNTYYGVISPYVVEYPFNYKVQDEILQSVKDYTKANQITDAQRFVQTDEIFFNKAIVYNDQQCSGLMNLVNKPKNNLSAYLQYPIYRTDSRDILFVKSDNFYNYNGFWDIVTSNAESIWLTPCTSLSEDKVLNTTNLDYNVRSYKKYQMRAKDCKIRHILDNRGDTRLTSQFILTENQVSYK